MRGQANLVALVVALLVLTTVTGVSLSLADGAIASAERDPGARRVAVALSERLVAPESPLSDRANALNASAVANLTEARLRTRYPVVGDRAVRLRLAGRTVVATGDASGGATMRRIVLVQQHQRVTVAPRLTGDGRTTLPRRTPRVTLRIDPPSSTRVTVVRANGRVVLHNASGLDGTFTVRVSRFETISLRFSADGPLPPGSVEVTYYPVRTTKALLEVTVDG